MGNCRRRGGVKSRIARQALSSRIVKSRREDAVSDVTVVSH
jgi:hypothetical protein